MYFKRHILLFLAILSILLCFPSCDLNISVTLPDLPADKASLHMTVALCDPPTPTSVESDRFYAYDEKGNLYRILWDDTREIKEGSDVIVEFSTITTLSYGDGYTSGWTPKYEARAKSVNLDLPFPMPDFPLLEIVQLPMGEIERHYDESVTEQQVKDYVTGLLNIGFISHKEKALSADPRENTSYLLYRENVTILIERSKDSCRLRYNITRAPKKNAYTPDSFTSLTSAELIRRMDDPKALYAYEITPRTLHSNTKGARLYEVVTLDETRAGNAYSTYHTLYTYLVLVGQYGILPLHSADPQELHYSDYDGDGCTEILYISSAESLGTRSSIINIIEVKKGVPTAEATELTDRCAFVKSDDGALRIRVFTESEGGTLGYADHTFKVTEGHVILTPVN